MEGSGFLQMYSQRALKRKRRRLEKASEAAAPAKPSKEAPAAPPSPPPHKDTKAKIGLHLVPTVDDVLDKAATYCRRHAPDVFASPLTGTVVVQSNLGLGDLETIEFWLSKHGRHQRVSASIYYTDTLSELLSGIVYEHKKNGVITVLHDVTDRALAAITDMVEETKLPLVVVLPKALMYTMESSRLRRASVAAFVLKPPTKGQLDRCVELARDAWVPQGARFDPSMYACADPRQAIYGGVYMDYEVCNGKLPQGVGDQDQELDTIETVERGIGGSDGYGATDYVHTVLPHVCKDIFDLETLCDMQSDMAMLDWKLPSQCVDGMSALTAVAPGTKERRNGAYLGDLRKRRERNRPKQSWANDFYSALDFPDAIDLGGEKPLGALKAKMRVLRPKPGLKAMAPDLAKLKTAREMAELAATKFPEMLKERWRPVWAIVCMTSEPHRERLITSCY